MNRQFVTYCIIGLSGVAVDFALYYLFVRILEFEYQTANFFSASAGIANNYCWNRLYNFRVKDRPWARFMQFYIVGLIGLILSALMLYLLIDQASLDELSAKIITLVAVVFFQYNLNKRYSFGS